MLPSRAAPHRTCCNIRRLLSHSAEACSIRILMAFFPGTTSHRISCRLAEPEKTGPAQTRILAHSSFIVDGVAMASAKARSSFCTRMKAARTRIAPGICTRNSTG